MSACDVQPGCPAVSRAAAGNGRAAEAAIPASAGSTDTFRIAVGVFHGPRRLGAAITDLHADGFTAPDLCLIGTRHAFERIVRAAGSMPQAAGLVLTSQPLQPMPSSSDLALVGTAGSLIDTLIGLQPATPRASDGAANAGWLMPELERRLFEHLRLGAVLVVVSAADSGLQRRSSRILLRHSTETVQTHEFTPPAHGGGRR